MEWGYALGKREFRNDVITERESWILGNKEAKANISVEENAKAIDPGFDMQGLYRVFEECDASLAEINPLIITKEGQVMALDAKMNFDSNAFFRQKEIVALRDLDEEDPREVEASKYDLSYISLDGNIACMVNGAGLAMATMGHLARSGDQSEGGLRRAIVYGSVVASFTVEDFGVKRLTDVSLAEIEERYQRFVELTDFHS